MDSNVQIFRVPYSDQDAWHEFRMKGIGGSEASTILKVNPYTCAARYFHQKIGNAPREQFYNEKMFFGNHVENLIAQTWRYYDGVTPTSYIENYEQGRVIRELRRINGYAVNSKYPWLFGSIDRLINKKGSFNLITREPLTENAILECKNISHQALAMWIDTIPQYFIIQIHVYMIIYGLSYCEVAMLVNGNELRVIPVEKDEQLAEQIIDITHDFWYKRVLIGREALLIKRQAIMEGNMLNAEEAEGIIQALEPEPQDITDYSDFLTERFKAERLRLMGTPEMYKLCKQDELLKKYIGRLEKHRDLVQNQLKQIFVNEQVDEIDFKGLGKTSWTKSAEDKSLVLRTKIKEKPNESFVDSQILQLKFEY